MVIKALGPDLIRIRIGFQPKMLDPDPDEMNADPQPWFQGTEENQREAHYMWYLVYSIYGVAANVQKRCIPPT